MTLPEGLVSCEDGLVRPTWAATDLLLRDYYDTEWGNAVTSEQGVFERLVLESFQSGLSWSTILKKREAFRCAFASFVPEAVAAFTGKDRERLMQDAGIVRNKRKIDAAITNARAVIALRGALAAEADAHRAGRMGEAPLEHLLRPRQSYPRHLGELAWLLPAQLPASARKCRGSARADRRIPRPFARAQTPRLRLRWPGHRIGPYERDWHYEHRHYWHMEAAVELKGPSFYRGCCR